jgi:hypothetical protein
MNSISFFLLYRVAGYSIILLSAIQIGFTIMLYAFDALPGSTCALF